jgi:hypothetical protein
VIAICGLCGTQGVCDFRGNRDGAYGVKAAARPLHSKEPRGHAGLGFADSLGRGLWWHRLKPVLLGKFVFPAGDYYCG